MGKLIRLVIAAAVVFGLVTLAPVQPAAAADASANTTMTPLSPIVGSPIAFGGTGGGANLWDPGEAVTIWLASTTGERDWSAPAASGDVVATAVADSSGNWGTSFILPDRKSGFAGASAMHEVFAQGSTNFAIFSLLTGVARTKAPLVTAVKAGLTVTPWIERSPSSGPPGTVLTLKGTGFRGNETAITVNFGRRAGDPGTGTGAFLKVLTSGITATSRGAWSATATVPDGPPARYGLVVNPGAVDSTTTTGAFAPQTFEIVAILQLSPSIGPLGIWVTLSGGGFVSGVVATVTLYAGAGPIVLETIPVTITTGGTGVVAGMAKIPPLGLPEGPAVFVVTAGGITTSATFTISSSAAVVSLVPAAGAPGIRVSVLGANFTASSPIGIKFDGETRTPTPSPLITTPAGSFSGSITIPWRDNNGAYTLTVTDGLGKPASALFWLNNVAATLTLSPNSGVGGILLLGRDFTTGSMVNVFFDGQKMATFPESVWTNNPVGGISPSFAAVASVPTLVPGQYEVMAIDISGKTGRAAFTVPPIVGWPGPPGLPGPVVSVVEKGARVPITVLDGSLNSVAGATVNLVNNATGVTALIGSTNAAGLLVLTAPNVTAQTWFRVESSSGSPIPKRVLVLDTSLASLPAAFFAPTGKGMAISTPAPGR